MTTAWAGRRLELLSAIFTGVRPRSDPAGSVRVYDREAQNDETQLMRLDQLPKGALRWNWFGARYINDPALRELVERRGSGLLANFGGKKVVLQRPGDSLRPSGPKFRSGSLNDTFS